MGLYLIDFENVHDMGINGITSLTDQDEVCLFYSNKSEHMSFDTHVNILKTDARIKYIKLRRSAKNYLDFQLVTHLGYLIGSGAKGPYYIISKDAGYDSVIDYWKDHGVTVLRQPAIEYNRNLTTTSGRQGSSQTPPAQVTVQENKQITSTAIIPVYVPQTAEETPQAATAPQAPAAEEAASSRSKNRRNNGQKSRNAAKHNNTPNAAEEKPAESVIMETPVQTPDAPKSIPAVPADTSQNIPDHEPQALPEDSSSAAAAGDTGAKDSTDSQRTDALPEAYRKKVRTALRGKGIPSAHYSSIYKAIINSYDKLALNNLLVKTFGSNKGGVVYNLIKDIFTDYLSTR